MIKEDYRFYDTYEELEKEIRILKLQNEIDEERIKINVQNIKEDLNPLSMVSDVATSFAKNAIYLKAASKLFAMLPIAAILGKKEREEKQEKKRKRRWF